VAFWLYLFIAQGDDRVHSGSGARGQAAGE
jgi:hypothetical protein